MLIQQVINSISKYVIEETINIIKQRINENYLVLSKKIQKPPWTCRPLLMHWNKNIKPNYFSDFVTAVSQLHVQLGGIWEGGGSH